MSKKRKQKRPRVRLTNYLVNYKVLDRSFGANILAKTDMDAVFLCDFMNIFYPKMEMEILGKRANCIDFKNTKLQ
jgi:hypothetical protein